MKLSVETVGKLWASGRNYASMVVGFIGGIGLISASQSKGLTDSLTEIYNGVSMIVHGATSFWQVLVAAFPLLAVWLARMASNSAKVENQAASVTAAIKDPNTPVTPEVKATVLEAATEVKKI